MQDLLKWHVSAKGRSDKAGFLCILIVLRSWFTHHEVCCARIVKCTLKSLNSVHSGEISRLLCQYRVNRGFSLLIGKTSEIAALQHHIKGIGALKFRCADWVYSDHLPMSPSAVVCKAEFPTSSKNVDFGSYQATLLAPKGMWST